MKSFRTELENPVVEKDIIDLEAKIKRFKDGNIDEEKFRSLRLARGVYGQRQQGVQMIRIKLPYGKVTSKQLERIAIVSDQYSNGKLHITTRQDIQIHYVSLEKTPELWRELEKDKVTLREACGNTVRNITASADAGVNPDELFDVSPYADALFRYLLRNPICQEMGRKFKIAFSATPEDTGLTYIHDIGFIPSIVNGKKGFKVMLGGGLGSQPRQADMVCEHLPTDEIIPFTEGVLRVFDRYGERTKRLKARMKFLIKDLGTEHFLNLVESEKTSMPNGTYPISDDAPAIILGKKAFEDNLYEVEDQTAFELWKKTNVFKQKQEGLVSVGLKIVLGNFSTDKARKIAALIRDYAADELRFTLRQNILIRHIRQELLPTIYGMLKELDLATPGYETLADITACPGTDTCNLAISGSTGVAKKLESVILEEYSELITQNRLSIKISGCMNACGQHNMSHIGFQGMSLKVGKKVAPALQVLLGGSPESGGKGRFSDKLIKIPSKRGPEALRLILDDYKMSANGLDFIDYYDHKGKTYFYELLKPLADIETLLPDEFIDWGYDEPYTTEVGVGECAGVIVDLVSTLLYESEEKLSQAHSSIDQDKWADAIYYSYAAFVNTAKAMLLSENVESNSHKNIIDLFDKHIWSQDPDQQGISFSEQVLQINKNKPNEDFSKKYYSQSLDFFNLMNSKRLRTLQDGQNS